MAECSGYSLLRDLRHNKRIAFIEKERDSHYLRDPFVSMLKLVISGGALALTFAIIGMMLADQRWRKKNWEKERKGIEETRSRNFDIESNFE